MQLPVSSPPGTLTLLPAKVTGRKSKGKVMAQEQEKNKSGLLVEDTTVVGGTDAQTRAPVIRPKNPATGQCDESTKPTDPRAGANKK